MQMLDQLNASLDLIIAQTQMNFKLLAMILLILWLVFFISCLDRRLLYLGIFPRHLRGIPGIFFAPLLHANFNHLFFNSIPLVVLSNFLLVNGLNFYIEATLFITIGSGLLLWCFGHSGLHIGASALITGYWALLVSDIYQQGTLTAILLGVISAYYFAGIFLGVFPGKKGVSWEGHLFGLLTGFAASYLLQSRPIPY
ncbi:membrane protein [Legionella oakridgensis ATCC 33761 = DSM 21215]|uniref:Membrane protein n=3 Tax=Legionella oakridgensis TaxID=29423 RepID=W0BDP4_9GAMM|nr:membrane protein [Legionella oakridgensis ATCC 33761 = DSM 21215]ETO93606.1 membrane protein [Legionella oakridgensis RV-2-2007]KTD38111.1 AraC family transcriptional regulator [Legionella oakridgensis]STY19872.1 putative rhomboid family protein [Legionella longbeachae]